MAAREDVNIRVSANIAEAIRMWKALESGPRGMANELSAMGTRGQTSARTMGVELNRIAGQWTTIAAKISIAKELLVAYMQANRQAQQAQDAASLRLDTVSRQFQVQSGTPQEAMAQIRRQINEITTRRGATLETGWSAATQLVSSGFGVDEVVGGGGLDNFLEGLNATAATGKDTNPKDLAFAVAGHLKATSQPLTAGNIKEAFQYVYKLFKDTNLQTENLARFASEEKVIHEKTGMQNEMLIPFSQLVDITDDARASTSLRSMIMKLTGAGANNRATLGLAEMGLTPEDVDMVGEDFFAVQKRIAEARAKMPKEDSNLAMQMVFGEEAAVAADTLLTREGVAETRRRQGWSNDPREYRAAAQTSETSLAADANRADVEEAATNADLETVTAETARKRFVTGLKKRGAWLLTRAVAARGFDIAIGAGSDVEGAIDFAMPGDAPWRALGNSADKASFKREVLGRTGPMPPSASAQPQDVNVRVQLVDQNNMRMPHRADVQNVGKNAAGRGR